MIIRYTTATKTHHITLRAAAADAVRNNIAFNLYRGKEFDELRIDTSDPFEPTVEALLRGRKIAGWSGSAADYIFSQIYLAFPEIIQP